MFQGQRGPSLVCYWGHLYLVFVKGPLGGTELLDLAKLLVQPALGILLYTSMPSCFYSGFWGLNSGFYIWKARALLVEPPQPLTVALLCSPESYGFPMPGKGGKLKGEAFTQSP